MSASLTAATILDAAEQMTQAMGYKAVSFRELGKAIGIKSASVHYHFPTKGALGAAIARRYTDRVAGCLDAIDAQGGDAASALAAYVQVFRGTLEQDGRMCLCGMLAAEIDAVPEEVRAEVRRFVELNVRWVAGVLARARGASSPSAAAREQATALFAALEGAMLVARGTGDVASFDTMTGQFRRMGLLTA